LVRFHWRCRSHFFQIVLNGREPSVLFLKLHSL
jgi:hypothetical protein